MKTTMRAITLAGLAAALGLPVATGHEFWIQPDRFSPKPGQLVRIGIRVGDGLPGEPVPRDPTHIVRFISVCGDVETTIPGAAGHDPAGLLRAGEPGCQVLGYLSDWRSVELPADKFEAYLRTDGLEKVIRHRAERGETTAAGREQFRRCAKALLRVGSGRADGFDRELGFPLELVPLNNPLELAAGGRLRLKLVREGAPVAGALVVARHPLITDAERSDSASRLQARTAPDGTAELDLPRSGMWLISAVDMLRAPEESSADWRSDWASLTFEVAPSAKPKPDASATGPVSD